MRAAEFVVDDQDFAVSDADAVRAQGLTLCRYERTLVEDFVRRFAEPAAGLGVENATGEKTEGLICLKGSQFAGVDGFADGGFEVFRDNHGGEDVMKDYTPEAAGCIGAHGAVGREKVGSVVVYAKTRGFCGKGRIAALEDALREVLTVGLGLFACIAELEVGIAAELSGDIVDAPVGLSDREIDSPGCSCSTGSFTDGVRRAIKSGDIAGVFKCKGHKGIGSGIYCALLVESG